MMRRYLPFIALALAGCTLGPNFAPPAVTEQAQFEPHVTATAKPVPDAWWSLFGDARLTALERRALDANLDLQIAARHLAQSRLQAGIAGAALLPTARANANVTREAQSADGVISLLGGSGSQATSFNGAGGTTAGIPAGTTALTRPINLYQFGFDASWEIDLWGRVQRSVEAAGAEADISAAQAQGVQIAVQAELARDYLQLRGVQTDLALLEQLADTERHHLDLMQQRAANGLSTTQAVADDRARLDTMLAQRPDLLAQQTRAMNAIAELLAAPPGALRTELEAKSPLPPTPPVLPVGLPSDLTRRRPDIRAAEARLHVTTAEIGVAEADLYPRITLSASAALQALQPHQLDEWAARTFGFGPGISLPIFEGGRLRRTVELRREEQVEAAIAYRRQVLGALHEVDNALASLDSSQDRQTVLDRAGSEKHAALDLALAREATGVGDRLAVLDAQSQALTADQASADNRAGRALQMVQLFNSLGGGWDEATR